MIRDHEPRKPRPRARELGLGTSLRRAADASANEVSWLPASRPLAARDASDDKSSSWNRLPAGNRSSEREERWREAAARRHDARPHRCPAKSPTHRKNRRKNPHKQHTCRG
jgi:hypothetical protein